MAKQSTKNSEPWPRAVCDALIKIKIKRQQAKSEITDLVKYRKEVEGQIDELGPEPTKERLALDHEYVKTVRAIDYQRSRERWLADQLESVIDDADQGKLFDEEIKTDISEKQLAKLEAAKAAAAKIVPRVGGVYRFHQDDGADMQGEVVGGGTKVCRVKVHSAKVGSFSRDEEVEIDYVSGKWKIEVIDEPKDALRVDQPKGGAAAEMKGKSAA